MSFFQKLKFELSIDVFIFSSLQVSFVNRMKVKYNTEV